MDLADGGTPNPSSLLGAPSLHHTGPPEDTHHQRWKQWQWGTVIKFPAVLSPLPKQSKAKTVSRHFGPHCREFLRHIPTSNPHKAACLVSARPTVQQSSSQRQTQHKVPAADLTCADTGIQRNWKLHHTINYNGCLHSSVRHIIPLPFQNLLFSYLSASDVSPVFSQPLSKCRNTQKTSGASTDQSTWGIYQDAKANCTKIKAHLAIPVPTACF